ncbi:TonB-dependent receptor plug domain-containing protein [Pontibacterium sp.]|uniref:TonB-dependent receptor plug domain-containing protein n=1 Tax=Pontibacterium sp. TaxID=2036026 RepID=UPI0035658175
MQYLKCSFNTTFLACALFAIPYEVHAASLDDKDFASMSLKDLVALDVFTSASLVPTQTSKAPGTLYTFSHDDFQRFGVRRLEDLLSFVPGLQLNQYRKRHRSVWARGLLDRYNDKMVLMVDGVRMQHLYYGHFSLGDNLPLEYIEKVEVILGPASSLYGANAFGGIISITTRDFTDQPSLETSFEAASNNRGKGTLLYNSENFQAFGSYLSQDAPFREERKSFIGSDLLQPLDEDYTNLQLKAKPLPGLTLSLGYNNNETPFLYIPPTQDAFIKERNLTLSAAYDYGTVDTGRIESTLYYRNDKAREYEIEQNSRALGYEEYQNSTMAGASVTGLKRWSNHVLAAGMSWQYEKAERTDFERSFHFRDGFLSPTRTGNLLSEPGITNNNYAAFVQDVWELNPDLSLTMGGRYDHFEQFGGYFNYRAAAVLTPDTQQTWKVQYGTAIRTPTFREYLKVLENTSFQPPAVDAEEIHQLELSYLYQWDEANLSLNLFKSQLRDFIHEVPTPDDEDEYFANSDDTYRMHGLEALFNARPTDKLNLRLGISYLKSETPTGELPYLAAWSGSLQVDYQYHPDHTLGFSVIHNNGRRDTNSFTADDAEAFVIANLFGFGQITPALNYSFGVDNLLDETVFDPAADFGSQHNNERSEREIWIRLQWDKDFL